MRISSNDVKNITIKYKNLNEDTGLGAGVPKQLNVTSIGSTGPKIPRSPIAALKGEVPGTAGVDENEESPVPMALGSAKNIAEKAQMLIDLLESEAELEPWAAAKITLAADYLESVVNYMKFRDEGGFEHEVDNVTEIDLESLG